MSQLWKERGEEGGPLVRRLNITVTNQRDKNHEVHLPLYMVDEKHTPRKIRHIMDTLSRYKGTSSSNKTNNIFRKATCLV